MDGREFQNSIFPNRYGPKLSFELLISLLSCIASSGAASRSRRHKNVMDLERIFNIANFESNLGSLLARQTGMRLKTSTEIILTHSDIVKWTLSSRLLMMTMVMTIRITYFRNDLITMKRLPWYGSL